jgi:hypothetical protein
MFQYLEYQNQKEQQENQKNNSSQFMNQMKINEHDLY